MVEYAEAGRVPGERAGLEAGEGFWSAIAKGRTVVGAFWVRGRLEARAVDPRPDAGYLFRKGLAVCPRNKQADGKLRTLHKRQSGLTGGAGTDIERRREELKLLASDDPKQPLKS